MEKLKKTIQINSLKICLIWFALIIGIITCMLVFDITPKSLTSYCSVYNEDDLNRCFKENPYVEVHTKKVYDTNYDYISKNKNVARFVDIELNGYWMIALVSQSKANTIFSEESSNIVIKGKLEKFETGAKKEGYQAIKESYVKESEGESTREEILNNFTLIQLNEYNGDKIGLYIWTILGIGAIIFCIVMIIKQTKYIIHPENYQLSRDITLKQEKEVEKIIQELESGNYDYHEKNIYLTKNYLILKSAHMKVSKRENIAWIYEKIMKQNGITTAKSWIVFSLDQKSPFNLSIPGKKHQKLGERLQQEFPNATFGYHTDLSKKWNKEPESFLKEVK